MDFNRAKQTNGFAKYASAPAIPSKVQGVAALAKPTQVRPAVVTTTRPGLKPQLPPHSDNVMSDTFQKQPMVQAVAAQKQAPTMAAIPQTMNSNREPLT